MQGRKRERFTKLTVMAIGILMIAMLVLSMLPSDL
jgi:predicted nucleic acid-binding Zn ribbon protein